MVGGGLEFGGDDVRATSNAFAANLAVVARDEAEDFLVPLAAEVALPVAHDAPAMFQSESGASAPLAFRADFRTA